MALNQVEIVARAVEVGRHDRDEVAAILPAIGLAELDAGDLGDRIPLVGGLQRAGQQGAFGNGLRRQPRINARGAHQQQLLDLGATRCLDHVRLDHQVVVDELGWPGVVGIDAADPSGGQEHRLWPHIAHPALELLGAAQVDGITRSGHDLAALALQAAHDGAAYEAAMAGNPDALIAQRVGRVHGGVLRLS